jgi:hypothetical protein
MGPIEIQIPGTFLNTNTIEEFKAVELDVEEGTKNNYVAKLYDQTIENLKAVMDGKEGVIIPTFKLLTFADLKKHMFSYQFLSASINVKDYKTISIEQANVVLKDSLPQLNKIFKEVTHRDLIPTLFVMRVKGNDLIESSIKEFIGSSLEEEFIFGCLDTVNYGGLIGYHTLSVLGLFALLLQ